MTTTSRAFEFNIGQLHADTVPVSRETLARVHGNFGVDATAIAAMNDAQLLRVADACRFLFNNLPPSAVDLNP